MKYAFIAVLITLLTQSCTSHKVASNKDSAAFLIGSWQFLDNKLTKNNQPFKAEDFPTVQFLPNQSIAMNFVKNESGSWAFDQKKNKLRIQLPHKTFFWDIASLEKDKIQIIGQGILVRINKK